MSDTKWESYEEVAAYLLDQMASKFGLQRIEGKQPIKGLRSGTEWVIDAKGIKEGDNEAFVIIECRRYTSSKQTQEKVGALAYRILDTGAVGGIFVSPLGLQEGGEKIAKAENISSILLDENSTKKQYILKFLNDWFIGFAVNIHLSAKMTIEVIKDAKDNDENNSSL
jgi:hypothetical protein